MIGPLSDRFGRRPAALWALAGFTAVSFLAAMADTVSHLILLKVIQAFAGACGMVLSRSIIKDTFPAHEISGQIARVISVSVIVPMVAPVIGGTLAGPISWRATPASISTSSKP